MLSQAKVFQIDRFGVWIEDDSQRAFVPYTSVHMEPVVPVVSKGSNPQIFSVLYSHPMTSDYYREIRHFLDIGAASQGLVDWAAEKLGVERLEQRIEERGAMGCFEDLIGLINQVSDESGDGDTWELLSGEINYE